MIWFYQKIQRIVLFKCLLFIRDIFSGGHVVVAANVNVKIDGPFMQIEKPEFNKLLIKNVHTTYFLPCLATIEERYAHQDQTEYFYSWIRNDKVLVTTSFRWDEFFIFANGSLRLPKNEKASGNYRCKVNANSTAVLSNLIRVEYPVLKRIGAAANISTIKRTSLRLDCPVRSVPPANISWFYGNTAMSKIIDDSRFLILNNGSLIVMNVNAQNGGKYKCVAQNQYSLKSLRQFNWMLTIMEDSLETPHTGQLLQPLQNKTQFIQMGSKFRILCRSFEEETPISWWFQRTIFDSSIKLHNQSDEFYVDFATMEEHQGYYTCATSGDRQTFEVIIIIPPQILEPLPSYETLISASITFRCKTYGNPKPIINWYHNGRLLDSGYTRYINNDELILHSFDPDEEGIYQCFARNIAGEASSTGEIRYKSKTHEIVRHNPWKNIRCFPHSFNTVNITFQSKSADSLVIVYIGENNPHRWVSPPLMKLNHTSYMVISNDLPVYRPFQLIIRVLYPTSKISLGNKPPQQTMLSSLRSDPVTCCTQGLLLHLVTFGNDTFVTWSQPQLVSKKYFIIQYSINFTKPHPSRLLKKSLRGTEQLVDLNPMDIAKKLTDIQILNSSVVDSVLNRFRSKYDDNETVEDSSMLMTDNIFNIVLFANVTGVLMQNFSRIKMRVLIVTAENENLQQDFRYVQWRTIENEAVHKTSLPFRLKLAEARVLVFQFDVNFNKTCINICLWQIQFPVINNEGQRCEQYKIIKSHIEVRGLKPSKHYRFNFLSCETQMFYGILDVQTLPDPPGTISNQRITRQDGLQLNWEPPVQANGKIYHYNILWTYKNVTHEANVLECTICHYKFPNVSERAKINVTIRVVGETGAGAPIYLDLRNISDNNLEMGSVSLNSDIYNGVAIGILLSSCCIFCFVILIIYQRRRFKSQERNQSHLLTPSNQNCSNNSSTPYVDNSTSTDGRFLMRRDYLELQTLIPKSRNETERSAYQQTNFLTSLSNVMDTRLQENNINLVDTFACSGSFKNDIPKASIPSNIEINENLESFQVQKHASTVYLTIKFQQIQLRSNSTVALHKT